MELYCVIKNTKKTNRLTRSKTQLDRFMIKDIRVLSFNIPESTHIYSILS